MAEEIDLRAALNAVSDVIQNRPRPLREFDQIYMKAGDMVMQSEFIARWADGKRLAFIGDGDAISVCVVSSAWAEGDDSASSLHHRGQAASIAGLASPSRFSWARSCAAFSMVAPPCPPGRAKADWMRR